MFYTQAPRNAMFGERPECLKRKSYLTAIEWRGKKDRKIYLRTFSTVPRSRQRMRRWGKEKWVEREARGMIKGEERKK